MDMDEQTERMRQVYPLFSRVDHAYMTPHTHPERSDVETYFHNAYELLSHFALPQDRDNRRRTTLGPKDPRRCAFCSNGRPDVSFKPDSHVVPAGLGNRVLFSYEECGGCNQRYDGCENALCEAFAPRRAFVGVLRRKGLLPKFKPGDKSFVGGGKPGEVLDIAIHADDDSIRLEPLGDGRGRLVFKEHSFNYHDAMRSIARIAWFLLAPERRGECGDLLNWIQATEPPDAYHAEWFSFPGGFQSTTVTMWALRAEFSGNHPRHVVQLTVGGNGATWFEPDHASSSDFSLLLPALPAPMGANPPPAGEVVRIKKSARVKRKGASIEFAFDRVVDLGDEGGEDDEPTTQLPQLPS